MDSHSSTLPAAVRLLISMLKRYSPGKGGRERGREREGEKERERREGGGTGEREEKRGIEHKSSMPMNVNCHE